MRMQFYGFRYFSILRGFKAIKQNRIPGGCPLESGLIQNLNGCLTQGALRCPATNGFKAKGVSKYFKPVIKMPLAACCTAWIVGMLRQACARHGVMCAINI